MPNQGNLFSTPNEPATAVEAEPPQQQRPIPRWILVVELALFILLRLFVGVLVILLPWLTIWTNDWIKHWPMVASFIGQGWVRGLVSGLGLLNIWIAFSVLFRRKRSY
jgi:uncharacterized membrane protein